MKRPLENGCEAPRKHQYRVDFLTKAAGFWDQGDIRSARREYSKWIRFEPKSSDAHFEFGIFLSDENINDLNGARAMFQKAIELKPAKFITHICLASAFIFAAKHEESVGVLNNALGVYSRFATMDQLGKAYNNRGWSLQKLGRFDEAREDFERAISHCDSDPQIHWNLGGVLEIQGDFLTAQKCFDKALEIDDHTCEERSMDYLNFLERDEFGDEFSEMIEIVTKHEKKISLNSVKLDKSIENISKLTPGLRNYLRSTVPMLFKNLKEIVEMHRSNFGAFVAPILGLPNVIMMEVSSFVIGDPQIF